MVFRKRRGGRFRKGRLRFKRPRRSNPGRLALSILRRTYRPEKKHCDAVLTRNAMDDSDGVIQAFCNVARGSSDQERDGNQILIRSLYMRGTIGLGGVSGGAALDSTAPLAGTFVHTRLMLFIDLRQEPDTVPVIADILATSSGLPRVVESPLNIQGNPKRFKILYDRVFILNQVSKPSTRFKFFKKMAMTQYYNGTELTDISRNGVYLLTVSSAEPSQSANGKTSLTGNGRIRYIDN